MGDPRSRAGTGGRRSGWRSDWWSVGGGPKAGSTPEWWPDGEAWPPQGGPEAGDWHAFGRRLFRRALAAAGLAVGLPLVVGTVLAVTIGGWTSVAVAVVFWLGLLIVGAGLLRFGLRTWRPVRDLIDTAGRLADGDYGARVAAARPSPVTPVVGSFNRMADRMERTEAERRRLLADIGHELRTPLTIVRGELEAIADGVHRPDPERLGRLLDDVAVMERLLDDLRTLSTAEAGQLRVHREPTDLADLVAEVREALAGEAGSIGVALEVGSAGPVEADIDPVRMRQVVANLVTNALRATPSGGRVEVTVGSVGGGGGVSIVVRDTGRGIPAEDLGHVFDRFHRGSGSDGSGLGLTVARNLVEAHGGTIDLTSEVGVGTTVTVEIPAS